MLQLVAVMFCHKPWAFQGIAAYLTCALLNLEVWAVLVCVQQSSAVVTFYGGNQTVTQLVCLS